MKNRNSLKELMEANERTYKIMNDSNNFLDTKAYNLLTAIGLILTIWLFSINYLIDNGNAISLNKPMFETTISAKMIIITFSIVAAGCYLFGLCKILYTFRGRTFYRMRLSEKNIEEFGKKSEVDVYEMLANVIDQDSTKLADVNKKKSILIDGAINFTIIGIVFTVIAMIITLLVI